jgi:hypothetical protein
MREYITVILYFIVSKPLVAGLFKHLLPDSLPPGMGNPAIETGIAVTRDYGALSGVRCRGQALDRQASSLLEKETS